MAESKSKNEWAHTSTIIAIIANVNRDPKHRRRPYSPNDFNPFFLKRRRAKVSVETITREMTKIANSVTKKNGNSTSNQSRKGMG